jgi:hypothetical protein
MRTPRSLGRRARRALLSGTLTVLVGCSTETLIAIERPAVAGALAWVVALLGSGEPRFVAQDFADPDPLRFESSGEADDRVEALVFGAPLETLGLASGPVTPAPARAAATRGLPAPLQVVRRDLAEAAWTTPTRADPRLAELQLVSTTPCRTLDARAESPPFTTRLRWAVPVEPSVALVGGETGGLWWASRDARPRAAFLLPLDTAATATIDRGSRVELGGFGGEITTIVLGQPMATPFASAPLPRREQIIRITGDPNDLSRELWVLTSSGTVFSRRSGAWTLRHQFSGPAPGESTDGGLAWLGPDRVLAGFSEDGNAVELEGERRTERRVFDQPIGMLTMQRLTDGTLVASGFGGVLARSTDGVLWENLGRAPSGLNLYAFAGVASAFWYGGVFGTIGEHRDDAGFCPPIADLPRGGRVETMLSLGEVILAVGQDRETPWWTWLTPR